MGALLGAGLSLIGQNSQNQFNASQAQAQMNFQEQMSNTAYQRSSQDMLAAGLNPLMMYGSGGAESTPNGAMATQTQNAGAQAVTSAQVGQQMENNDKQMDLVDAQTAAKKAEALNSLTNAHSTELHNTGEGGLSNEIASGLHSAVQWLKSGIKSVLEPDYDAPKQEVTPQNVSEGGWHGIVPARH